MLPLRLKLDQRANVDARPLADLDVVSTMRHRQYPNRQREDVYDLLEIRGTTLHIAHLRRQSFKGFVIGES